MSEMVVRVEAAIIEELGRQKIAARAWGNSFEGLNPPVRWDVVTRAAIEAMREPTDEMSTASPNARECWRTMINVILSK